jgi:hypothetical protein
MTLNGVPTELWPEVVHGDIETPPLAEIGNYISALAAAGQLPEDAGIKRKLLEFAKLPIPEEEVIAATPAPIEQPVQKKKRYVRSIPMKSMGSPPRDLK